MKDLGLSIEYIYNSGVVVENEKYRFIFDYYQGDIELKNKKTFVLCSHEHYDHFNPEILEWKNKIDDITYIFSSDIINFSTNDNIHLINPDEELFIDGIYIKTFGSTDAGVSFLLTFDEISVFHAGDLNWWYWDDDSEEEKLSMEKDFKAEIEKIKKHHIDLAFFPVDPRLEDNFFLGGQYFIEEINPKYFVPIHFREIFISPKSIAITQNTSSTTIIELTKENSSVFL